MKPTGNPTLPKSKSCTSKVDVTYNNMIKSGLYFRSKGNSKIGTCKIVIKIKGFYSRPFEESI